jgi:diacylglycerol kinase (ATP)
MDGRYEFAGVGAVHGCPRPSTVGGPSDSAGTPIQRDEWTAFLPAGAAYTPVMHSPPRFSWLARARSFGPAARGLWVLLRHEHNARLHAVATVMVVSLGVVSRLTRWEWGLVVLTVGLVWATEALNSSLEGLADLVESEPHPAIGRAKDLAAGGVLAAALAAATIGLLVFGPRLVELSGVRW